MAQTRRNKLNAIVEAFKLGGDNTVWSTMLTDYLSDTNYGKYGIAWATNQIAVTGSAAQSTTIIEAARDDDLTFAGYSETDDTNYIVESLNVSKGVVVSVLSADPLSAHYLNFMGIVEGVVPAWEVFAAGEISSLAADDATIARTVTGSLTTDMVFATQTLSDDTDQICAAAISADGTLTLTVSDDPGATPAKHKYDYVVIRRRGNFEPSHRIILAGQHTSVGGSVNEAISLPDALATGVCLVQMETSNDTDVLVQSVLTDGVLTVTSDADPLTAHIYNYAIFRAN